MLFVVSLFRSWYPYVVLLKGNHKEIRNFGGSPKKRQTHLFREAKKEKAVLVADYGENKEDFREKKRGSIGLCFSGCVFKGTQVSLVDLPSPATSLAEGQNPLCTGRWLSQNS